jgi:hypothetical protein
VRRLISQQTVATRANHHLPPLEMFTLYARNNTLLSSPLNLLPTPTSAAHPPTAQTYPNTSGLEMDAPSSIFHHSVSWFPNQTQRHVASPSPNKKVALTHAEFWQGFSAAETSGFPWNLPRHALGRSFISLEREWKRTGVATDNAPC